MHEFNPAVDLTIFKNNQFGSVRTVIRDGEPWFVAVDVCRILGLSNTTMAVARLDDDERMTISSSAGNPTMAVSRLDEDERMTLSSSAGNPTMARLDERMTLSSTPGHSGNPTMAVARQDERMTLSSSAGNPSMARLDERMTLSSSAGNPTMARLDERMTLSSTPGHTGHRGGAQSLIIVNEPGLYTLVLGSRKPEAKAFKRWITHEVIPAVRKHGGYLISDLLDDPDLIVDLALKLKARRDGMLVTDNAQT